MKKRRLLLFSCIALLNSPLFWPSPSPPPLPGEKNPLELYEENLSSVALQAIKTAQKNIYAATYTLSDREVIREMGEASKRGVSVHLVVDRRGWKGKRSELGDIIFNLRPTKGLMHEKWIVIDEKLSFFGSANLTGESLRRDQNLLIGIDSTPLAKFLIGEQKRKKGEHLHLIGSSFSTKVNGYNLKAWTCPKHPTLMADLLEQIESAKTSLEIALFTWTHPSLTQAVVDSKMRGVKVTVLLDRGQALGASLKTFLRLLKEGIPVGLSHSKGLLHHKFVWIDRRLLICGSFNWTKAAVNQNEELVVSIESENPIDPFWKKLETLWNNLIERVEWQKSSDWVD